MLRFLIRRFLFGALVLWLVSVSVFVLFFVAPHDPARLVAGRLASPDTLALVRHRLGLDQPVFDQYRHFLGGLLHGDLGYSYYNSEPVRSLLFGRLPVTISLALGAVVIWLVIGIGVGVVSARRPRSATDRAATVFVLTGCPPPRSCSASCSCTCSSSGCTWPGSTGFPVVDTYRSPRIRPAGLST
jgi:peptide/nickel transport system permease protein